MEILGGIIEVKTAEEMSDIVVKLTDQTITPELCKRAKEIQDKNITWIEIVHKSKTEDIYRLASEGKLHLFYCPSPIKPAIACEGGPALVSDCDLGDLLYIKTTNDPKISEQFLKHIKLDNLAQKVKRFFNLNPLNYYLVSAEKAMPLFEMIKNEYSPKEITNYLGLENRVSSKKEIYGKINISPAPALTTT